MKVTKSILAETASNGDKSMIYPVVKTTMTERYGLHGLMTTPVSRQAVGLR